MRLLALRRTGVSVARKFAVGLLAALYVGGVAATQSVCDPSGTEGTPEPPIDPLVAPHAYRPLAPPARAELRVGGQLRTLRIFPAVMHGSVTASAHIVVADASSGQTIWTAPLESDASQSAARGFTTPALLRDAAGMTYRAYLGDAVGRIWRIDLPLAGPAEWGVTLFADFSTSTAQGIAVAFTVTADVFRATDSRGRPYDGLAVPALMSTSGAQRIAAFLLRDYALGSRGHNPPIRLSDLADAGGCRQAQIDCPAGSGPGWYRNGVVSGDALGAVPLVDGGRLFIDAYVSDTVDCSDGSAQRFFTIVDLRSGSVLLPGESGVALGRQPGGRWLPRDGRIQFPGLESAVQNAGAPDDVLRARGMEPRRRYWRDLLIDAR
jgi:hypothetical protein